MGGFFDAESMELNAVEVARRRAAARGGYVDLTGSNPTHRGFLFPAPILESSAHRYWYNRRYDPDPRGLLEARQAVCRYYRQRTPTLALADDQIFLTASTSESYSLLFSLLTDPGDNILAPEVTYPLFEYLAAMYHIELRPYAFLREPDWAIDGASLLQEADSRTKAVLLISPHNPTGMIVHQPIPELDKLGCPVICDEVFAEFTCRIESTPPLATVHPALPVFHLNGISKMLALPDLKLGWIALNSVAAKRYAERLALLNDTFLGCNSLMQTMLPDLLDLGQEFAHGMYTQVRQNLYRASELLADCPGIVLRPPQGGYYLFPQVATDDEEALVVELLEESGVFVYPGYFYAHEQRPLPDGHIMISCLSQPEPLLQGITRLRNGLEKRFA